MKIVYVKHQNSNKKYIFSVTDERIIHRGDLLKVKTRYGDAAGIAVSGTISGDVEYIISKQGLKIQDLSPIIGIVKKEAAKFAVENQELLKSELSDQDVPF